MQRATSECTEEIQESVPDALVWDPAHGPVDPPDPVDVRLHRIERPDDLFRPGIVLVIASIVIPRIEASDGGVPKIKLAILPPQMV